jgi:hypothetical protein
VTDEEDNTTLDEDRVNDEDITTLDEDGIDDDDDDKSASADEVPESPQDTRINAKTALHT